MTDDDEAMYARPTGTRMERATEIMSRAHCMQPEVAGLSEQEQAAKIVADRQRMKIHDQCFGLLGEDEELVISQALAKSLGYSVGNDVE